MVYTSGIDKDRFPYLHRVETLKTSFPCLGTFTSRLMNVSDEGRRLVDQHFQREDGSYCPPGRCCVLEFRSNSNRAWGHVVKFKDDLDLFDYLQLHNPLNGPPTPSDCSHRLYILEDISPEYVELIGRHLHVDPLIFASQINTWKFLNSKAIAQRTLPSLSKPAKSFTLRYHEPRTFDNPLENGHCTFASNRRTIDSWFPIPGGRITMPFEAALVRHCASFWVDNASDPDKGWNALLLVDPPISSCKAPEELVLPHGTYTLLKRVPTKDSRYAMFRTQPHISRPYNGGHPDPIPESAALRFTSDYGKANLEHSGAKSIYRRKNSLFDEAILYWTQKDNDDAVRLAIEQPFNTMQYVLKIVAYHWTNTLELFLVTLNQAEFLADEGRYQQLEEGGDAVSGIFTDDYHKWKKEISRLYVAIYSLNVFRRRLAYFEDDVELNLERLGCKPDGTLYSPFADAQNLPLALQDAMMDFSAIAGRVKLYKDRADALASTADEIVNLRGAAKSLDDGAFNLRLAVLAAVVFPPTLIAALFGMSDGFKPGDGQFWIFWAVSIPSVIFMVIIVLRWDTISSFLRLSRPRGMQFTHERRRR
ncbi:uncharacterized protein BDR25DRAFT_80860 [Lindgomyces ingoldianus]|uniref:Uncharacterized protein n=1 Tax=Lindgomyces ingoldianus TaxID=673940 RepID=A0ACB6QFU7_9PLEO|nr:uncharacterized protein BDR25DRAFT_80860 [Lindgomyces ingoldianus]KAF2465899.1 hypothetical protein BDR25DRAFT_80860 [Lindgomyces ingoldianus]